ncbi:trehalose-phosphatase [Halorussus halophilus]|uniref:trehalose-phosphatase n=1 Tax=Halorussus halophilus TaxID=2650975 RepID=UPI001CE4A2F1|nr:trehalose-phosphatase [Halorussus halophilus]
MMTEERDSPPLLRENLHALVEGLVAAEGLFVLLDFDGTLASIESRPDDATMPDPTREAIVRLADAPNVEVGVVSGRALADVRQRLAVDERVAVSDANGDTHSGESVRERSEIAYAGNHGLELYADGQRVVHPVARETQGTIEHLCDQLTERLLGIDGALVERKGVTATVHTRLVADEAVPFVSAIVESLASTYDDVRLTTGKDVLELRPAVAWDKGEAVHWLADEVVPDGEQWFPVYLGDDTTDEAAFAALADHDRGFGVKVGSHPPTDAPYRVSDPEAVRQLLSWLAAYGVEFIHADLPRSPLGIA